MEWWSLRGAEFGFQNADCGQFTGTAEAQSKPNEDSLTSKKTQEYI